MLQRDGQNVVLILKWCYSDIHAYVNASFGNNSGDLISAVGLNFKVVLS